MGRSPPGAVRTVAEGGTHEKRCAGGRSSPGRAWPAVAAARAGRPPRRFRVRRTQRGGSAGDPDAEPEPARERPSPVFPPRVAYDAGYLPLAATGVDQFRLRHPTYDGRGVLIGILDSGLDPGVDGLRRTSGGTPKVLDVRDFAGEGAGGAQAGDSRDSDGTVRVDDRTLMGAGRIARVTGSTLWYSGALRELSIGEPVRRRPERQQHQHRRVSRSSSSRRSTAGWRLSIPTWTARSRTRRRCTTIGKGGRRRRWARSRSPSPPTSTR